MASWCVCFGGVAYDNIDEWVDGWSLCGGWIRIWDRSGGLIWCLHLDSSSYDRGKANGCYLPAACTHTPYLPPPCVRRAGHNSADAYSLPVLFNYSSMSSGISQYYSILGLVAFCVFAFLCLFTTVHMRAHTHMRFCAAFARFLHMARFAACGGRWVAGGSGRWVGGG